jgi:hypothetical protein
MNEEKRIVTFMGEQGKRTATIGKLIDIYEVELECEGGSSKLTKFFKTESEAEELAMGFAFEGKYGTF